MASIAAKGSSWSSIVPAAVRQNGRLATAFAGWVGRVQGLHRLTVAAARVVERLQRSAPGDETQAVSRVSSVREVPACCGARHVGC